MYPFTHHIALLRYCSPRNNEPNRVLYVFQLLSSDKEDVAVCPTSLADHAVFEDKGDALYQLPQSLGKSKAKVTGHILNMDIINECAPVPALKLGEDMRRLILALYAKFLSVDGRTVDYDGIKGYNGFYNIVI